MGSDRVELRAISPDATPEEVAAIVAAVTQIDRERRASAAPSSAAEGPLDGQRLSHWRASSRLSGRRTGMTRGPWRLSGRLTRRTRA